MIISHDEKCTIRVQIKEKINAVVFHRKFNGKKIASSTDINNTFNTFFPLITSKKVIFIVEKNVNVFKREGHRKHTKKGKALGVGGGEWSHSTDYMAIFDY